VPRGIQQRDVIVLGQMRSQQAHGRQRQVAPYQSLEDDRKSAHGTSGLDPSVSRVFGQA